MTTLETQKSYPQRRSCYINFAEHLLNVYNPNMNYPGLPYEWSDENWFRFLDMIRYFGYTTFEFWLVPKLFCREGLSSEYGHRFTRQLNAIIKYGLERGLSVKMQGTLSTVGEAWHTHCPNDRSEWDEVRGLWEAWIRRFPGLGVIGIFPGDPGGCSRNGCTCRTFIDKALEIAEMAVDIQPLVEIELGTWGPPFFGWGNIQGPPGWKGEFIQSIQGTAWAFDKRRSDNAMEHLCRRLSDFPTNTSVSINLGFNADGNPGGGQGGEQDARGWAREIAKTNSIVTWDFSLTEGENAVIPHYRFRRLFERRRQERDAAPYSGGICFTMTPALNQLSLYLAAQSFMNPDGEPQVLVGDFYKRLFGEEGRRLIDYLPYFEIIPDWGNYDNPKAILDTVHRKMGELEDLLESLTSRLKPGVPFFPDPETYRHELLWFTRLYRQLSGSHPDYPALRQEYWRHVYSIYDRLPEHVDPRPHAATDRLVGCFRDPH